MNGHLAASTASSIDRLVTSNASSDSGVTNPPCLQEYRETVNLAADNWILVASPWIFLSVSVFGLLANSAVLVAFGRNAKIISRNPRLLVLNQSAIDLCACIVTTVKWATLYAPRHVPDNAIGTFLCHFWFSEYIIWMLVICSTLNLQVITVERFIALVFPMVSRSLRKVKLACACVWLYSLVHHWRVFIEVTRGYSQSTSSCCVYTPDIPVWQSQLFGLQNFSLIYALPLINMTFCYSAMICSLRRNTRVASEESLRRKLAASRVLIKTFTIAGVAYVTCFSTNQICYLLHMFHAFDFDQKGLFYNVSLILVNLNMIVNPVIYFLFMPTFKTALLRLIRCDTNSEEIRGGGTDPTGVHVKVTRL